nr:aconitate hydratase, cytoplasmic [Ipomoea batatas]
MYMNHCSLLRASSSVSSLCRRRVFSSSPFSPYRPSASTFYQQQSRPLTFASAFRSLRCSVPRWSHGVDWKSPASLTAQIRTAAPVLHDFHRKIATMGTFVFLLFLCVS